MEDSKASPLVTVVIPMFNAFPFIGEMLECMEKQTYTNWELIIVDDGSTDESVSAVKDYAEKDHRIKLIHRPENRKKGGNTCRNIGLENAKGEYIIWFDADDLIAPYCLEQRVRFIQLKQDLDFAIFPAMAFREKIGDTYVITGARKTSNDYLNFLKNLVPFQVVTNIYHRRRLIEAEIRWDEKLQGRQDPDFNLDTLRKGLEYEYSHLKPDYFWRINGNQSSVSKKILTATGLNANIYYLDKRMDIDMNGDTMLALDFLSFYLIRPLLIYKDSRYLNIFIKEVPKLSSLISLKRLSYYSRIKDRVACAELLPFIILLFFPFKSLRAMVLSKKWGIRSKYLAFIFKRKIW